jgi:integrase
MASKPYFDPRRGTWRLKYKPDPEGPWVTVLLCKHPTAWDPSRPPKKPPQLALDRAHEFSEIEYRAKHGLRKAPNRAKSLAVYVDDYIKSHGVRNRKGSTKQLRRHAGTFLEFCGSKGVTTLQAVTKAICREYLESRAAVAAPSTLKTERGFLVGIFTRANEEDNLISLNPWKGVKVPGKVEESKITFWTKEEVAAIVGACRLAWHRDLILFLVNTGIRISTVLEMRWDWIDWAAGVIEIPSGEEIKTSYKHVIGRVARDVLQHRILVEKTGSPLVFPNPRTDKRIPYDSARSAIDKAIARAKVRPGTPHDLRHTYARLLILAGAPVTVVQSQLGHTTLAMTMRYVKTTEDHAAPFVADFGVGEG